MKKITHIKKKDMNKISVNGLPALYKPCLVLLETDGYRLAMLMSKDISCEESNGCWEALEKNHWYDLEGNPEYWVYLRDYSKLW